jgi:salicylate hydroxylase
MMSLIGQPVTVLGAGVAGLAVARALALHGAQVTVLEQADAIREVGAGLQISPNGAAVLKALGLAGGAGGGLDAGRGGRTARRSWTAGWCTRLDLARLRREQGYHFLHRADLIELSAGRARPRPGWTCGSCKRSTGRSVGRAAAGGDVDRRRGSNRLC